MGKIEKLLHLYLGTDNGRVASRGIIKLAKEQ